VLKNQLCLPMNRKSKKQNDSKFPYLVLNPSCSLKCIEYPCVYNKANDNLYKLNEDTLKFLAENQILQKNKIPQSIRHFVGFLRHENILLDSLTPVKKRKFVVHKPPIPSLRYLLVHLTLQCNLRCKHCYVAPNENKILSLNTVKKIFDQMQEMQGLIVLLSGGEPLYYPNFWKINDILPKYDLRFEMLSNGTLITKGVAERLNVQHVQVSLDGMQESHDFLRGKGSFKKAVAGIENLIRAGKEVSISTMIHKKNVKDFNAMKKMLDRYGIKQWLINQPSALGRWCDNLDNAVPLETAIDIMIKYARGKGPHQSKTNRTCGSHICTVLADGRIFPCPFLNDRELSMGTIDKTGLRKAWKNYTGITIEELEECRACEFLEQCRGGCRFRAKEHGNICGEDPVLCAIYKRRCINNHS
jgi:radical SAM protein with 4Fe4S-binding SPASM domain